MLVSIIIPCYNSCSFIGEAIESALRQEYSDVEVIVIDDGSTDESLSVIQSFGTRIQWRSGPNQGGSAARNLGLSISKGEFVQFLDSDDILYPDKLSRQVPIALERPDQLTFCDAEALNGETDHTHYVRNETCSDPLIFMLEGGLQTAAPLHHRPWLLKVGGFRTDLACSQERDLHLRLAASGIPFHRIAKVLYGVRRTGTGVSASLVKVLKQHEKIVLPIFDELQRIGELTDARSQAFAEFLARDARHLARLGEVELSERYFQRAASFHSGGGISGVFSDHSVWLAKLLGPVRATRFLDWIRRNRSR